MNLAVGALSQMSDMKYDELNEIFRECQSIRDKWDVVGQMDLDFPKVTSSQDMMETLNKVTSIFKEVASAWK